MKPVTDQRYEKIVDTITRGPSYIHDRRGVLGIIASTAVGDALAQGRRSHPDRPIPPLMAASLVQIVWLSALRAMVAGEISHELIVSDAVAFCQTKADAFVRTAQATGAWLEVPTNILPMPRGGRADVRVRSARRRLAGGVR